MGEIPTATGLKRINAYLSRDFMRLVAEDIRLSALWNALIPAPLVAHTRPLSYSNGHLALHADSAAWASRLKQQKHTLCQRLRRDPFFKGLADLSVRIAPPGADDISPPIRPAATTGQLSPRATALLRSMARTVRDPELRAAFERLARTAGATTNTDPTD